MGILVRLARRMLSLPVFFVCVRFELFFGIQLSVASLLHFLREGV